MWPVLSREIIKHLQRKTTPHIDFVTFYFEIYLAINAILIYA